MPAEVSKAASDLPSRADGRTVSAITVTYYTGPVLWACIASILEQPELLELIVVVNGADREVRARLANLADNDQRVLLVKPGRNVGGLLRPAILAPALRGAANSLLSILIAAWHPGRSVPCSTFSLPGRMPGS